eukprot:Pgem_evm1s6498
MFSSTFENEINNKQILNEILKQVEKQNYDKAKFLEVIEGVFNVDSLLSWVVFLPDAEKFANMSQTKANNSLIENLCRLKYLYNLHVSENQNMNNIEEVLRTEVNINEEVPQYQVFSYLYRFNRYSRAECHDESELLVELEKQVKLCLTSNEIEQAHFFQQDFLPRYQPPVLKLSNSSSCLVKVSLSAPNSTSSLLTLPNEVESSGLKRSKSFSSIVDQLNKPVSCFSPIVFTSHSNSSSRNPSPITSPVTSARTRRH